MERRNNFSPARSNQKTHPQARMRQPLLTLPPAILAPADICNPATTDVKTSLADHNPVPSDMSTVIAAAIPAHVSESRLPPKTNERNRPFVYVTNETEQYVKPHLPPKGEWEEEEGEGPLVYKKGTSHAIHADARIYFRPAPMEVGNEITDERDFRVGERNQSRAGENG
eukprot:763339-Hanusia_phi.AAC.1